MNEFLHSLRTAKDKRYERPRRQYDGNQYNRADRQNPNYKKRPPYRGNEILEQLPELKKFLSNVAEAQTRRATAEERKAAAEERQAAALELIAQALRPSADGQDVNAPAAAPVEPAVEVTEFLESEAEATEPEALVSEVEPVASPATPETFSQVDEPSDPAPNDEAAPCIAVILEMRNNGTSYVKIAKYLADHDIPTLSGRGQWRGQLVSKIFQEHT